MRASTLHLIFALFTALLQIRLAAAGYAVRTEQGITVFSETHAFGNGVTKMHHQISVSPSTAFAIELTSNPTTGYMWGLMNPGGMVNLSTNDTKGEGLFVPPSSELAGAAGKQRIFFTAPESEGSEEVVLAYRRPWEKTTEYVYTVTVNVAAANSKVADE